MTSKQPSKSAPRRTPAKNVRKTAKKQPIATPRAPKPAGAIPAARTAKALPLRASKVGFESQGAPVSPSELSSEVMEFITAIDKYKRANRRPFPSWSEVFEIVKGLGYNRSA